MEFEPKTLAVLFLIFVILFKFIWTLLSGFDDLFDEFWDELDWKDNDTEDENVNGEQDDRPQSGEK